MSFHCVNIKIPNIQHKESYIIDVLHSLKYITRGDTIMVNDHYIFGYDGISFLPSHEDYIPIAVGSDLQLNTFNKYLPYLDHVLLDIEHDKTEMLENLTPFTTMYKGLMIYFITTNPSLTYKTMLDNIKAYNTLLVAYVEDKLLFVDIDHDLKLDMEIISNDEIKYQCHVKWNDKVIHIEYGQTMHLAI